MEAVIPEVKVYIASRNDNVTLKNIHIDTDYARDDEGKPLYFTYDESKAYLKKQGKSLASLPLLTNIYLALDKLSRQDEGAAKVLHQLNNSWDRTGTEVSNTGKIVHNDGILGQITYDGLTLPEEGKGIADLFSKYDKFFRSLLGMKDIDKLAEVADRYGMSLFYWYPRGERLAMFGGGDFYYMHFHIPGLLMVFCDDEPFPYRVVRGVWR